MDLAAQPCVKNRSNGCQRIHGEGLHAEGSPLPFRGGVSRWCIMQKATDAYSLKCPTVFGHWDVLKVYILFSVARMSRGLLQYFLCIGCEQALLWGTGRLSGLSPHLHLLDAAEATDLLTGQFFCFSVLLCEVAGPLVVVCITVHVMADQ